LATERNYVDTLKAMKVCFREFLIRQITAQDLEAKNSGSGALKRMQSIVGKQSLKPSVELVERIFLNLDPILSLHDSIVLPALEEKMASWAEYQTIGDIFEQVAPWLRIYNEYSNNYETSVSTYTKMMDRSSQFAEWIEECSENSKKMCSISELENLLINPIQRIPRYGLLLGDLLSKTPDDHPDAAVLRSSTAEISRVADYLDKNMTECANNKRMLDIGSKLRTDNAPDLLLAHRKLLCETIATATCDLLGVTKQSSFSGVRKLRVVLFNDILIHIPESKGESSLGDTKHHWPLNLVWFQKLESSEKAYNIELIGPGKRYVLKLKTEDEQQEWLHALRDAIKIHIEKLNGDDDPTSAARFGTFHFENGAMYNGWWKNGLRWGSGRSMFLSESYIGNYENDVRSGDGTLEFSTQDVYRGEFKKDRPHGIGELRLQDGSHYSGQWLEGLKHGNGKFCFANGDIYYGSWELNLPHGHGTFHSDVKRAEYVGNFEFGLATGQGKLSFEDGRSYEGQFAAGQPEGRGRMDYGNGMTYDGEWNCGVRHGHGVMRVTRKLPNALTKLDTELYDGHWKYDLREGTGTQTYVDGGVYEGEWKRARYHGTGSFSWAFGPLEKYEGDWVYGRKHGKGNLLFRSGHRYRGAFRNDIMHGNGSLSYPDTSLLECKWVSGVPEGKTAFRVSNASDWIKLGGTQRAGVLLEEKDHPCFEISLGAPVIDVQVPQW